MRNGGHDGGGDGGDDGPDDEGVPLPLPEGAGEGDGVMAGTVEEFRGGPWGGGRCGRACRPA